MAEIILPHPSEIISAIRTNSAALTEQSNITISSAAIDRYLDSIDPAKWAKVQSGSSHGIRLPLLFDSLEEEINIISTLALLNFLSGYRTTLHRLTTRGAWSTILSLVLSAHLADNNKAGPLTTQGMLAASTASLAALAQIQTHVETDHPTLGSAVKVGTKDDEAIEVLELVAETVRSTGQVLRSQGKRCLGQWVVEALRETNGDAGQMVYKLASTFPAFCDAHEVGGQQVYLFKKALFLLSAIHDRFATDDKAKAAFPLPRVDNLPIFADNVLPTMLLHHGILDACASTDPLLAAPPSPWLLPRASATRLRAAAVAASAAVVARAGERKGEEGREWMGGVTEVGLDGWVWTGAKEGGLREVERMAERGTVYY